MMLRTREVKKIAYLRARTSVNVDDDSQVVLVAPLNGGEQEGVLSLHVWLAVRDVEGPCEGEAASEEPEMSSKRTHSIRQESEHD